MKTEKWFLRFLPIFLFCFVLCSLSLAQGKLPVGNKSAEELYSIGLSYSKVGKYDKAVSYFEKAVKENPNYADAYFQIGYCNQKFSHYTEAVGAYKQVIRIKPDYAEAYNNLGMAYDKLARRTEAIESFKQAIHIKPDYTDAYNNLGLDYNYLGRHTEAIESFKQAISINSNYADAYYNIGWAHEKLGHYTEASEAYKQAIRINPEYTTAAQNHLEKLSHYTETSELSQKNESPQVTAVERIGDTEIAQVAQQKEVEPTNDVPQVSPDVLNTIEAHKQAISIKPEDVTAHNNLGVDYDNLSRDTKAIAGKNKPFLSKKVVFVLLLFCCLLLGIFLSRSYLYKRVQNISSATATEIADVLRKKWGPKA